MKHSSKILVNQGLAIACGKVDAYDELYDKEYIYTKLNLSPEEIERRRQDETTEEIVQRIFKTFEEEVKREAPERSEYMRQALNYFDHYKDRLFLYRKNGSYPIDNNIAERAIRPFAVKRKTSLHFGSDEGAEMSAVYHSIISTIKLQGKSSIWKFFGSFFESTITGSEDYLSMLPAAIR